MNFFGQISIQRYFVFVFTVELRTLYIQELPYMNTFCECILKKIGPTHAHFQYNARKLMSLKFVLLWCILRENKIIRRLQPQLATFEHKLLVLSRFMAAQTTIISAPSGLENLSFEFPAFFHLNNIDVTSCFCRQFFRPLYEDMDQKIAIFNCDYLGDACFNWAETS